MKREIKFRAWSKESNKMMNWYFIKSVNNLTKLLTLNHVEVMQFTGLTDKNGKEIYEGDVLKASDSIIEIEYKGRGFEGIYLNKDEMFNSPIQNNNYLYWEIIGNIYENPELLKTTTNDRN